MAEEGLSEQDRPSEAEVADPLEALREECEEVSRIVLSLAEEDFAKPTRLPAWNVKELLGHMYRDIDRTNTALSTPPPAEATADSVSAVCRSAINQTVTPDELRGRMSSVFMLVVASGPRLGDVEAGAVASVATPRFSVVSGGLACVAGVGLVVAAFPALAAYDGDVVASSQRP